MASTIRKLRGTFDMTSEIVIENEILGIRDQDGKIAFPTMVLHPGLDLDEATTLFALDLFGIRYGEVEFRSSGEDGRVEGKTAEEWLENGYILVDVGGNGESEKDKLVHLDHNHSRLNKKRCAVTICLDLIERDTGARPSEILAKLVKFVRINDLQGGRQFLDLADVCKVILGELEDDEALSYIKRLLSTYISNEGKPNKELFCKIFAEFAEDKPAMPKKLADYLGRVQRDETQNIPDLLRATSPETVDIVRMTLEETYLSQMEHQKAVALYKEDAMKISLPNDILLVHLETDNSRFHSVALGEGADIIAVKRSNGHVQIFTQKSTKGVRIGDITAAIRYEEARTCKTPLPAPAELRKEGTLGVWHYFEMAKMLLNGSSTAIGQKSTKIGFKEIVDIIIGVQSGYMPFCQGGRYPCSKKCNLYPLGFEVCRKHQTESRAKGKGK